MRELPQVRERGNGKFRYISSNPDVALVDKYGTVTIKRVGTTKITVIAGNTQNYREKSVQIALTVEKARQKINGVKSSYQTRKRIIALRPKASGKGKLTYKSSNRKIATVNAKGKVTFKKKGKVTVTIKAKATVNFSAETKKVKIARR